MCWVDLDQVFPLTPVEAWPEELSAEPHPPRLVPVPLDGPIGTEHRGTSLETHPWRQQGDGGGGARVFQLPIQGMVWKGITSQACPGDPPAPLWMAPAGRGECRGVLT